MSEVIREALDKAGEAMNAWLGQYAADCMSEEEAAEATEPLRGCGTLWYIAEVNAKIDAAKAALAIIGEPFKDGHRWSCVYHLEHDDCTCDAQWGGNPKGQDLQGLDAKHDSPVGEADAPKLLQPIDCIFFELGHPCERDDCPVCDAPNP